MLLKWLRTIVVLAIVVGLGITAFYIYDYLRSPEFLNVATTYGMGKPLSVKLSGTGSMYPTFPKGTGTSVRELSQQTVATISMYAYPTGIELFKQRYFSYDIARRDIVSFENARTKKITAEQSGEERGFLKRVYALPGDTVEFRDGIAFLNGVPQKEPYIAHPRSSFGGEFLNDCTQLTIPPGKVFVMGDNRKVSADSRSELGLVDLHDIDAILPLSYQKGVYDKTWRDTSRDLEESERIKLDTKSLLVEINKIRTESKLAPLTYNAKLERSATKRGDVILKYDDLSSEATASGYTMAKSMRDAGYSNITWSEFPILGYYENSEYLDAIHEYPRLKKVFTDADFQDIGIGEVTSFIKGCPKHVIVTQLGGYIPPNYSSEMIASWKKTLDSLRTVYPGWKAVTNSEGFYLTNKKDIDRIFYLFDLRIKNISDVVSTMEANKWLSDEQREYVKNDAAYAEELSTLTKKINDLY